MGDADERIAARPPAASTTPPEFLPMPVGSCVPNWGGARLGLRLIHVGLLFCYFGALLVPVVMLFPLLGEGRGVRTPAMNPVALFLCGGLLLLVPGGLILTGEAMLWTAPEECGARRWAVAAFLLGMVGKLLLGVAICGLWLTLSHPGPVPLGRVGLSAPDAVSLVDFLWQVAATLGAAATIGEAVLLALALRALAVAVGHPKLGRRAVAYARLLVIFTMIGILLNLLCIPLVQLLEVVLRGSLARNIETSLPLLLLVGELLCSLILLVQFVELVGNTRQAVVGTYESASAHD